MSSTEVKRGEHAFDNDTVAAELHGCNQMACGYNSRVFETFQ
jgi:hypothetical protein